MRGLTAFANTAKRNRHKETGRETGVIELYRMQEAPHARDVIGNRGRGVVISIATLNILVILDRITKYTFINNPALRGKFF